MENSIASFFSETESDPFASLSTSTTTSTSSSSTGKRKASDAPQAQPPTTKRKKGLSGSRQDYKTSKKTQRKPLSANIAKAQTIMASKVPSNKSDKDRWRRFVSKRGDPKNDADDLPARAQVYLPSMMIGSGMRKGKKMFLRQEDMHVDPMSNLSHVTMARLKHCKRIIGVGRGVG